MATQKPFYRYHCDDLNMDIYVTDIIDQPDYGNYSGSFIPLTKAFNIPIVDKFRTEIDTAFSNRVDWSSGVIRLGRIKWNNTLTDYYLMITISTNVNTGRVVYTKGYGNGVTYTHSNTGDTSYADLDSDGEMRKQINICRRLLRSNYNFEGMPNYNGNSQIELFTGPIQGMAGTWTAPGGVNPYGKMTYAFATWTSTHAIPDSIPCAENNAQSRSEQSEIIGQAYGSLHYEYGGSTSTTLVVAYDGSYDPDPPDPSNIDPNTNDPGYPSGPGGGHGNHSQDSDPITVPGLPGISALSTGFMTLYYGNTQMIHAFMSNLWVQNIADAIKNFFAQPMDFILGAMILPIASQLTAASAGSARPKFGLVTFDSALPYVETQFYEVDCGEIDIEEYWGSCFDFDPYTKITIWLPYIGYKDLLADEVMGHSIYVKYHIDAMNGDCVAFVGVSSTSSSGPDVTKLLGQYTGNCGVQIPLSGQSFDNAVATSITLLGSAAGVGISAGLGAAGLGEGISGDAAMALTHATASVVSNMKPNITRGGSMGSSSGLMSMRTPYIIKRIPRQSLPENFRELRGYPSNIYATLSQLTGFAAVEDIQLNNIPAMETERKEIIEWLKGGVLL